MDDNGIAKKLNDLVHSLYKECNESNEPDPNLCEDIIQQIGKLFSKQKITIAILEKTEAGKVLTKCKKAFKRHHRSEDTLKSHANLLESSNSSNLMNKWDVSIQECDKLLRSWKECAKLEAAQKQEKKKLKYDESTKGLPKTVNMLHGRLVKQKKEIYKNPPVLPPPSIIVHTEKASSPKRNKSTGELIFQTIKNAETHLDFETPSISQFRPNLSPEQILRGGAFGGTYFRTITSAVTNESYHSSKAISSSLQPKWIEDMDSKLYLSSQRYNVHVNKFRAKCGGSLGMWESSGWISDVDPYGWFQWYCRFYAGRRCSDDERQIARWSKLAGVKGRFLSQLCNKCIKAGKKAGDASISPVIRQTLWHWGIEVTDTLLERHKKRIGLK